MQRLGQSRGAAFRILARLFGQRRFTPQTSRVLKADARERGRQGAQDRFGLRVVAAHAEPIVPIGVRERAAHRLQAVRAVIRGEQRFVQVGFTERFETLCRAVRAIAIADLLELGEQATAMLGGARTLGRRFRRRSERRRARRTGGSNRRRRRSRAALLFSALGRTRRRPFILLFVVESCGRHARLADDWRRWSARLASDRRWSGRWNTRLARNRRR